MPEFTRKTDERHVVSLPSAIESVRWSRRRAAPGGIVGLEVQTLFCGEGSRVELQIVDARRTTHASLSGQLHGNCVDVELRVPEEAEDAVVAKATMPNHGLAAESEPLQIAPPVRVSGPRWSTETVGRGDVVTLTAEARGAPDGERALIRILEEAPEGDLYDPVTRMRGRVDGGAVKEPYQFQYPGETENIPAEWGTGEGYTPPRYVYEVDVLGVKSISTDAKQKGRLRFVDDLSVQVVEHESGAPYPNRNAELTLADGSTRTGSTDGAGRIELEAVPPGPAKVNLPDLGTPAEQAERGREPSETVSIRAESTAPAVVATGTPWRIDVRREKRPATL